MCPIGSGRLLCAVFALVAVANRADAGISIFHADVNGVNNSTFDGNCFIVFPPDQQLAQVLCRNLGGGSTPDTIQFFERRFAGDSPVFTSPFPGGSMFEQAILDVPARIPTAARGGYLGVRFLHGGMTEGEGMFESFPAVNTIYPMFPISGDQSLAGLCFAGTQTDVNGPFPFLSVFCEDNFPGSATFGIYNGTTNSRGTNIVERAIADPPFLFLPLDLPGIDSIITQPTNANIHTTENWIGGNNLPCRPDPNTLCLNQYRFRVQIEAANRDGQTTRGQAVGLSNESGAFSFFAPDNIEVVVKVLNSCQMNSRYWVFAGGLTDIRIDLTVTDTRSNEVKRYFNPLGTPFQPIQDTSAFATCP